MTKHLAAILVLIATLPVAIPAAVPLRWTVETNRVQPVQFEAYHGEALEFEATFNSLGKPLALDSHTATLYYQTNGMDQAWWSFPASVSGNVARAVFTPAMDPAAKQITVFLGVSAGPSNQNYRASALVRFRNSPGAAPGWIEPPVVKLDFSTIDTLNAPWFTKDESNDRFPVKSTVYTKSETDSALAGKQDVISDLATIRSGAALGATAVQPSAIGDMETKTHTAATYQPKGSYLTAESDPTVPSWAKAASKPTYTWTEIGSKPTFATVATSGAYSDLTGKPTIPAAPGNYATVSNCAMSAVQPAAIADMETKTHAAATYQPKGQYLTSETDPTVSSAISTHNSSTSAHSDIRTAFAGKQDTISDLATIRTGATLGATAVQPSAITDMETKTHAAQTYQPKGSYLTSETDPTVSSAISTHNSSTSAHSDIRTALAGKQDTISDLATIRTGATLGATAVQPSSISDMETQTHAAQTYQPKGSYLTTESDPTVASAIGTHNSSSSAHSDLRNALSVAQSGITIAADNALTAMQMAAEAQDTAAAKYAKPSAGIPKTDLAATVQTSLGLADSALQSFTESDPTVSSWAKASTKPSYTWTEIGSKPTWIGSSKPSYTWSEIGSKPTFATVATSGAYSDLSGRPTIPTALKCPTALTINVNGALAASYDGSVAKTVNISTGGSPGGTITAATLVYHADGQAVAVSVAQGGTFSATLTDWPDGQSQMAFVTLAAGASVSSTIKLIGYSDWPTGEEFMAVATRRNSKIYINPVCITEE